MGGFPDGSVILFAMFTGMALMLIVTLMWFMFVMVIIGLIYRKHLGVRYFDAYPFRFWLMSIPAGPFAWFFFASIAGRKWFRSIITS